MRLQLARNDKELPPGHYTSNTISIFDLKDQPRKVANSLIYLVGAQGLEPWTR
jgi:hypothetical protein